MIDFLTAEANIPFTISIAAMLILAAMEILGAFIGLGISSLIDSVLPDFDVDVDIDADIDTDLGWMLDRQAF